MTDEAHILINGQQCTQAEAVTIRRALESFATYLAENGLGDDDYGKYMTLQYQINIKHLREKMRNT